METLRRNPNLSVPQLARRVNLSASRLQHLFREETGTTISAFAMELKLELAETLLLQTARPIKQICEDSGIGDRSHFIKVFKKWKGVTPAAYRRRYARFDAA